MLKNCSGHFQASQELELKRKKEEADKLKQELEWYERKMQGKKRKPRKQKELVVEDSFWTKYKWSIVAFLSLTIVLLAYIFATV